MTDAQIKHMVDRFLIWQFPENISPDGGFSFKRTKPHPDSDIVYPMPVGTNLLDAQQAEAMVRHMLEGLPADEIERLNRKLDEADKIVDRLQAQKADAEGALEEYIKHCRCNEP